MAWILRRYWTGAVWAVAMLSTLCAGSSLAQESAGPAPGLAVHPLYFPEEPEYGVFMADRIAYELMQHSYFPPLQRRRFELVETDTLGAGLMQRIAGAGEALPGDLLEAIRTRVTARYLLTGDVTATGHLTLHLKFIDLEDGRVRWQDEIVDNPSWTWTRSNREVGEITAEEVRVSMGYGKREAPPPPLPADALPRKVLLQPIYCPGYKELAADYRIRLREHLTRDGLFDLLPGEVGGGRERITLPRLGSALRRRAHDEMGADAVLCGSLRALGKDATIYTMAALLRLVEVPSGRVLWTVKAAGRRVWRWDKLMDITEGVVAHLSEDLAQFAAGAAEDVVAGLLAAAVDGPGWCAVGEAYLQRGLVKQAEAAFQKALTFPDGRARAHNGLGEIYVRLPETFARAVDAFQKATQEDPGYLVPYANLARAYLGRDITTGVGYAKQAIEIDSTYSLPYRALGDWYEANEDDRNAVDYYGHYLELEPEDVEVAARMGRALIRLQDYEQVERVIAPILRAHPEATALLPVVAFRAYRVGRFRESERYYRRFLNQTDRGERINYEMLDPILPPAELRAYVELSDAEKQVFAQRFWTKQDPDLTTEVNERLLEHYGRVWIARRDYSDRAYPWDRRGDVYIRYGEPDYRARSGWIPRLMPQDVQQIKDRMYTSLYKEPTDEELVGPVFPIRSDRSIALARLNEEVPEQVLSPLEEAEARGLEAATLERPLSAQGYSENQEAYAPVTLQNDNSIVPWESWVYVNVGGGMVVDFTEEPGGSYGYDFAPLPPIAPVTMKSDVRMAEYAPAIAFQQSVSEEADAYAAPMRTPLPGFHYDLADFRADEEASRLDVGYSVPASALGRRQISGELSVALRRSVALADSSYSRIYRQSREVRFPAEAEAEARVVDLLRSDIPPGLYHMTVTVVDAIAGRGQTVKQDVPVEVYGSDRLQISDLMLAERVSDYRGAVRFRRGPLEVVPNPERAYSPDRNLVFYYEIYNLKRDTFGQTKYRVMVSVQSIGSTPAVARPFGRREQPEVGLSFEQVGEQEWERTHLAVDLEKVKPGRNLLKVTVEDLNGGGEATKEAEFYYGASRDE